MVSSSSLADAESNDWSGDDGGGERGREEGALKLASARWRKEFGWVRSVLGVGRKMSRWKFKEQDKQQICDLRTRHQFRETQQQSWEFGVPSTEHSWRATVVSLLLSSTGMQHFVCCHPHDINTCTFS